MAEYIDRAELSVTPIDITDLPRDKCLMVYLEEDVDSLPTADVIERSEYDKLYEEYLKAIHRHTECLKELHEYRSKIDKAIAELEDLKKHKVKSITSETKLCIEYDTVMEILKRNLGGIDEI